MKKSEKNEKYCVQNPVRLGQSRLDNKVEKNWGLKIGKKRKKGSKAMSEKRIESLHNDIVKNLGASKKANDENQRLL